MLMLPKVDTLPVWQAALALAMLCVWVYASHFIHITGQTCMKMEACHAVTSHVQHGSQEVLACSADAATSACDDWIETCVCNVVQGSLQPAQTY